MKNKTADEKLKNAGYEITGSMDKYPYFMEIEELQSWQEILIENLIKKGEIKIWGDQL